MIPRPLVSGPGRRDDRGVASVRSSFTPAYRVVLAIGTPIMRPWSRLAVTGLDVLPRSGPTLLVADHDSYWDPIAIGVAAREVRQIRALAKSSLWKTPVTAAFMNGMGHIPVQRGSSNDRGDGDRDRRAAHRRLHRDVPRGHPIARARAAGPQRGRPAGRGRCPKPQVVCVRTIGSVDVVRVPKRPSISVEFFRPRDGGPRQPGESATRVLGAAAGRAARVCAARGTGTAAHRGQVPGAARGRRSGPRPRFRPVAARRGPARCRCRSRCRRRRRGSRTRGPRQH